MALGAQQRAAQDDLFRLADWRGEPLHGRRILVWDEQGLGDLIQFARYLEPLVAMAGEVTLLGRPSTFRLLATLPTPAALHRQSHGRNAL